LFPQTIDGVTHTPRPLLTSARSFLRMIELARVRPDDVSVDVGSGLGRATAFTHVVTGAGAIGLEIQSGLVRGSRALARRLNTPRVGAVRGDAVELTRLMTIGSVFFL
jgi:protein-L-isoaspartate O-methyltransferase